MQDGALIPRFGRARRDPALAVLEGFHPLKHALRFGANVLEVVTRDRTELERLTARLAPDIGARLATLAREVEPALFDQFAPLAPSTGVMSLAERPRVDLASVLAERRPAPVVLLEDPRDLGNMGACVRVGAAADVAGVLTTGSHDPWHPDALRGAAGLHYAVPVCRVERTEALGDLERPLLAIDPDGEPLDPVELPAAGRARLRQRARRPQPRAAGDGRRARAHPHAPRRFQPEPCDLGGGGAVRLAAVLALALGGGLSGGSNPARPAAALRAQRAGARRRAWASTPSSSRQFPRSAARALASIRRPTGARSSRSESSSAISSRAWRACSPIEAARAA